jgi:hypothetical protein
MPVVYMAIVSVKDWQALQKLNNEIFMPKAKVLNARCYQICRDPSNPARALLWAKVPDLDDAHEMRETVVEQVKMMPNLNLADDWLWESIDLVVIEDDRE